MSKGGGQVRKKRRVRNLLKEDPHCYWCRRSLQDYPGRTPAGLPDFATLDHLNSRVLFPHGRPLSGRNVLSCQACNGDRAAAEKKGVYWTPGCREPGPFTASRQRC